MKKSDIFRRMSKKHPHLTSAEAEIICNTILNKLTKALKTKTRAELRNFGVFSVKYRTSRKARNPKTGEIVMAPAKYVPFFKAGKELNDRINKK
jgi:integration host factor subunit beta